MLSVVFTNFYAQDKYLTCVKEYVVLKYVFFSISVRSFRGPRILQVLENSLFYKFFILMEFANFPEFWKISHFLEFVYI